MELRISPTQSLRGHVLAPASKSYTIRAVLCALLADGRSIIRAPLCSRDTQAAFDACKAFGGAVALGEGCAEIAGTGGRIRIPDGPIDALNSGTTIRICGAIATLAGAKVTLTGDESNRSRPVDPLLHALTQLGARCSSSGGRPPFTVEGPLKGGRCGIRGDVSSQFVSAILMAAPYARKDVEVELTTPLKSRPYVDLTLDTLGRFGVRARNVGYERFTVESGQTYRAADYTVEGDYSSAAFILAAAALTKSEVTVGNLFAGSLQADKKIVRVLSDMGAKVKASGDCVSVSSDGRLHGVTVDVGDSPDLVPILSVLGALADGETRIVNASHARLKECDRLKAMAAELAKMGADVTEKRDEIILRGGRLKGAKVDGWGDHRIIMSLAVAGLKAAGKTAISGAEHVDVTFPNFAQLMGELGANIR